MIIKILLISIFCLPITLFANVPITGIGSTSVRDNDANNRLSNIESKTGIGNQDRKLQLNELKELKDSLNNNYVDFNSLTNNQSFSIKIPENNLPNIIKDRNKNVIENKIRNMFKNKKTKVFKRDLEKEKKQKIRDEQNLQALIITSQIINNNKYAQGELDQLISEAGNLKTPKESMDFNNKLLLLLIAEARQEKVLKAIEIRNNITKEYDGITEFSTDSSKKTKPKNSPFPKARDGDWNFNFN